MPAFSFCDLLGIVLSLFIKCCISLPLQNRMVFSNIDLLKELYFQSKTRNFVDTCLQANDGCIYVHWTVLLAAGNDWLVDVGDDSSHTIIFPDHSVTELESFVQRLYCQAPRPSTPFVTVPNTPPEMFVTAPETPVQHHSIPSPKEIEARLLLLCEERSKLEQMHPESEGSRDDIKDEIEDDEDVELPVEAEEAVICPVCGLHCTSKTALSKHKTEVHQMSPTVCNVCGKTCDNRKGLRNHMRQHKKKTCDICDTQVSPSHFKQHRQKCLSLPPNEFQCALCDFKTSSKGSLKAHIKTHAEAPFFKCKFCDYASHDKSNIRKHIQEVHRTKKFHCHACSRKFNSLETLQRHIRNVHEGPPPEEPENISFNCEKCDFKSTWKSSAMRHKNVHLRNLRVTAKQPNICYHCGMKFTTRFNLKRHQKRCKQFVSQRMTEEQCVGLMHKGFNKTDVNVVLKLFRRICGRNKVQQNVMKSVDSSINDVKKWFKSEPIVLRRNPDTKLKEKVGQEFTTCVSYCKDVKAFIRYIKKGRKIKNADYLISGKGSNLFIYFL